LSAPQPADPTGEFERYRHDVYAWAIRLLGRHHDALDVAQDVFVKWIGQAEGARPENARSWLRRVTVNRAIDMMRARRATPAGADVRDRPAADGTPPAGLAELRAAIGAGLQKLSETQRGVLTAKVFDGLTFAQIARELDLAVPTVKTHYLRALRGLRAHLERDWDAGEANHE